MTQPFSCLHTRLQLNQRKKSECVCVRVRVCVSVTQNPVFELLLSEIPLSLIFQHIKMSFSVVLGGKKIPSPSVLVAEQL